MLKYVLRDLLILKSLSYILQPRILRYDVFVHKKLGSVNEFIYGILGCSIVDIGKPCLMVASALKTLVTFVQFIV